MTQIRGGGLLRNRWFVALVGAVLGFFVGVALAAGVLLLLHGDPESLPGTSPAAVYDIQAVVEERYINRIMVQSANEMAGPVSLSAGKMDIRPGGVADFVVRIDVGPLQPVFEGRVGFRATEDGSSIEVVLLDARFGRLQLNRLVPDGVLDDINADIKRLLVDKIGSQGLYVLDVQSDETTLILHLGREPQAIP
ncbi:MAG: hypothetical protein ACP5HS_03070 [Anaerolineae bacterium]